MNFFIDTECSGWPFVKTAVAYDVVDSTSDRAAELVREGRMKLPLLVWARTQTRGRGRGIHRWWSDKGSLTFTLAIDPLEHRLSIENEPRLALATAVAVIEALDGSTSGAPPLGIRWPNDLEADGRKLGGILPERLETPRGRLILVGIGLNVRTDLAAAPARVRAMATSLAALHAKPLDESVSERLLPAILGQIRVGTAASRPERPGALTPVGPTRPASRKVGARRPWHAPRRGLGSRHRPVRRPLPARRPRADPPLRWTSVAGSHMISLPRWRHH